MAKKKVLQLITLSEIGGAQKVVYSLAKGLDKSKFEITVASSPDGELVSWLKEIPEVKIIQIPELVREINPIADIKALIRIFRLIRSEKFDIVHCHSSKAGIIGRIAARLAKAPRIFFTVHGWGFDHYKSRFKRMIFILMERTIGKITDNLVCVSSAVARKGFDLRILDANKTFVIFNGVDFINNSGKLIKKLHMQDDTILIGTVCRLAPPKLPELFIQVAEQVLKRNLQYKNKFIIVGDGPLNTACKRLVEEKGFKDDILLVGKKVEVYETLVDFDIFVLLSESEGLPIVILEAMAAGKPVVASDVGGINELVTDSANGYLVENICENITEKLCTLILNQQKRLEMGKNSRKFAERFTVAKMVLEYEKIYLKEVGRSII